MSSDVLCKGRSLEIRFALDGEAPPPGLVFVKSLERQESHRFAALFMELCERGHLRNPEVFHNLEEHPLWEIRTSQYGMFSFFPSPQLLLLADGHRRKPVCDLQPEIDEALRIRNRMLNQGGADE